MNSEVKVSNINHDLLKLIKGIEVRLDDEVLDSEMIAKLDLDTEVEVKFFCTPSEKHKIDRFEYKAIITLEGAING